MMLFGVAGVPNILRLSCQSHNCWSVCTLMFAENQKFTVSGGNNGGDCQRRSATNFTIAQLPYNTTIQGPNHHGSPGSQGLGLGVCDRTAINVQILLHVLAKSTSIEKLVNFEKRFEFKCDVLKVIMIMIIIIISYVKRKVSQTKRDR